MARSTQKYYQLFIATRAFGWNGWQTIRPSRRSGSRLAGSHQHFAGMSETPIFARHECAYMNPDRHCPAGCRIAGGIIWQDPDVDIRSDRSGLRRRSVSHHLGSPFLMAATPESVFCHCDPKDKATAVDLPIVFVALRGLCACPSPQLRPRD